MTYKDGIGSRSVPFHSYDDLDDPKSLRIVVVEEHSEVHVHSPNGNYRVDCPQCQEYLSCLAFFSVDKVAADQMLPCRGCGVAYEIGDCRLTLLVA